MYQIFVEVEGNIVFTGMTAATENEAKEICKKYNAKYNATHTYQRKAA